MRKLILVPLFLLFTNTARADLWGGDLPLLAQIVTNTLYTLYQLQTQTKMMEEEMNGIKDKINRIQTIAEVVQPSSWDQWKDPAEALRRLKIIYYTLPKEYHSEKAQAIEDDLSKAMNAIARISPGAQSSFNSGKELERRGADSSPGVAQKLTATGVGSLVSLESQNLVLQSHITNLLAQILADANEKETRMVASRGASYGGLSSGLGAKLHTFSSRVFLLGKVP
jgi:hypothetical protein